ncbi:MAG: hypothetical protein QM753_20205 [Thermomicrobiales bacterium]
MALSIRSHHPSSRSGLRRALPVALAVMMLTGGLASPVLADDPTPTPPPSLVLGDPSQPCAEGMLHVRDLEGADATLQQGISDATALAQAWQKDARLYAIQLSCPLLRTGYSWNGIFFSQTAQAFYRTDTLELSAAEDDPSVIPTLDPANLSFRNLYRSLLKAGFDGAMAIDPSNGITVRQNTAAIPFGPPNAPKDKVLIHLAIIDRNETKDVWVDAADGTVYRYEV